MRKDNYERMRKGRSKIYLRKIEDATKCQVSFCKRRSGLAKKVDEVLILCDVDIAFIAFSPTGRSVHLFSHNRFEEVLLRYIDVPINKRNYKIDNPEEKIKEVEHIISEQDRVAFLKSRINHLQVLLNHLKTMIEVEEAEASNIRPGTEILSLSEALWREQYLEATLKIVNDMKIQMMNKWSTKPFLYNQTMITQPQPLSHPRETSQHGLRQTSFGFFTPNAQQVNTPWITESQFQYQTPLWHNAQSSQRLGKAPIWNEIIQGNQHEQAMGKELIDQNHTWVNTIPMLTNSNSPMNPMLAPPPMLPINQQPLIIGNNNYIPNQEQQMAYDTSSFMNNQNWQEGIQLPAVSPMSNFIHQESNWFPNASSSSYGQNLNAPKLTVNPPRVPSILSDYNPSSASHVDPFMRIPLENPNIAIATTSVKNNNRVASSYQPITTTTVATVNNHQAVATASNHCNHPITTATKTISDNHEATLDADIFYHPLTINNPNVYCLPIQNRDTTLAPPPPPAQADERVSLSNNSADHEMLDEEIEALMGLLVNLEDFVEDETTLDGCPRRT